VAFVCGPKVRRLFNQGGSLRFAWDGGGGGCANIELMWLFNQIFQGFNSRRTKGFNSRRTIGQLGVEIGIELCQTPPIPGRIINLTYSGAKIELEDLKGISTNNLQVGSDVSLKLKVPKALDHLILYASPIPATAEIIWKNKSLPQLGLLWKDINAVFLSALIHASKMLPPNTK